ncbi:hypothetical protein [Pedosphaera parvula]|uniref:hypothetical protein n=1 Tax=Pedosphaera parvula TaxID=1032527 RepID=UPI00135F10EC|nr:hypothetical protein [Pedosphaera parvula]
MAPPGYSGGVKSLYTVCGWLGSLGKSTIQPFDGSHLVHWFAHRCEINQNNYKPDLVVYPAIHPINMGEEVFHLCCAFGKYKRIESHADLVVCKSPDTLVWLKEQNPKLRCVIVKPSIQRSLFEYDGRPKKEQICYMTRSHKFPETASQLRERYGNKVVEIVNQPEAVVAEMLKDAKVFVWRGNDKEGSPRPPKEALVAGCVVVGLNDDLNSRFYTDFGLKCSTVEELVGKAGEALRMPMPGVRERAVVRDSAEEKKDWVRLIRSLKVKRSVQRRAQG